MAAERSQSVKYDSAQKERPYYHKSRSTNSWAFQDPELKRKKRVASYKVFAVEGKVKHSFRSSFRWIKDKYIEMRYGWW